MSHAIKIIPLLFTMTFFAGCTVDNPAPEPSQDIDAANNTGKKSVIPDNDRLTKQHVLLYVAVKQTEQQLLAQQELRKGNIPAADILRYQDIERKAAQSHKLSPEEYLWIKNTVINSQIQFQFQEYFALNTRIIRLLEDSLLRHDATKSKLKDTTEIAVLDEHVIEIKEHIATLKSQIKKYTDLSENQRHNIEVVSAMRQQLQDLQNPLPAAH